VKPPRDRIWVDSHAVGGPRRTGEIVEVLGAPDRARYRVRWEDGRETIVYPGSDASLSVSRGKTPKRPPEKAVRRARKPPAPAARPTPPAGPTAAPGDRLVIRAHHVGERRRDAEILEVRGPGGKPPFLVRWDDTGDESLFFPGSDVVVEHFPASKRARPARGARAGRTS
jgi:hypothetical protein